MSVVSSLDQNFERKVEKLREEAELTEKGMINSGQPAFDDTEELGQLDRSKVSSINSFFDRSELAVLYSKLRTEQGDGRLYEVMLVRWQHAFLAGLERDMQVRCRSQLKSLALAAGARRSFGIEKGPIELIRKQAVRMLNTDAEEIQE